MNNNSKTNYKINHKGGGKMKTFRVFMAETHSKYYEVQAEGEDQAIERAYFYDEDQEWALDTYDEGVDDQVQVDIEEVEE